MEETKNVPSENNIPNFHYLTMAHMPVGSIPIQDVSKIVTEKHGAKQVVSI